MLKAWTLAACLLATTAAPAAAANAGDFVVGSVRDEDGTPIERAEVRAFDAGGTSAGADRTDRLGTFAIPLTAHATRLEIRCAHCRAASVALGESTNLALVVTRYRALETSVPDARDLAALPYGRPADALALVPFVLGGGNGGAALSDRGLGGGRGLISDDGAPLVDLATATPANVDFPDRYVRAVALAPAERAYRYGSYGGGGVFALESLAAHSSATIDAGAAPSANIAPVLGDVHPTFGVSSDDGTLARRGDLDVATPFAGGALRAGATDASERIANSGGDLARAVSSARLAYATASRRFRTQADISGSDVAVDGAPQGTSDYRSSYLGASARLEYPGAIDLAAGVRSTRETTFYARRPPLAYALSGRADDTTAYVEADRASGVARVHAALALENIAATATLSDRDVRGSRLTLLPALDGRIALGGGAYAGAGYSQSLRLPTLLESDGTATHAESFALERADLVQAALGFDGGGRVRGEAIVYRELTGGFDERRLVGIGASLVWQVAPSIALRAWSLRATPHDFANGAYAGSDASRQVLWATYANATGVRFDAIAHRDVGAGRRPVVALDGDAYVPFATRFVTRFAIDLATSQRANVRRYSIGLRVQ